MKRTRKQIGSLLLSVFMVFTMLPAAAFAKEGVQDSGTSPGTSEITAFADLAENVALQEVESGTTVEELNLPSTLTVTVTTGSAITATVSGDDVATDSEAQETETQEETTIEVSNWVADPDYDGDTAGDYTFTPTLDIPEDISVAAGVTPPQITVTVEETAAPMLLGAEMQLLGTGTGTVITDAFTDDNFLTAVYAKIGKTAPEAIYDTDVSGITSLEVIDKSISSLAGIEHFAALTYLNCNNNQLTALDVSNNTALTQLYCNSNQLTTLDVSNNTALTHLYCNSDQLTTLDVSNNTALTQLYCYSNQLTSLNVSGDTALTDLTCYSNLLTSLDVSDNTALTHLHFSNNRLTSLNVSLNTALTNLDCGFNRLTSLDLTQNTSLSNFFGINQAVSLTMAGSGGSYSAGVSMPAGTTFGNAALSYAEGTLTSTSNTATSSTFTAQTGSSGKTLSGTLTLTYPAAPVPTYNADDIAVINSIITNNGLDWTTAPTDGSSVPTNWTKATWSNSATNKRIIQLSLPSKNLSGALDVSGLTALQSLLCDDNQLTSLNASGPVNLTTLSCASNQLTSLNVSGLTRLTFLSCDSNQLTSLDASGLTALQSLRCDSNRLTSLNVSGLTGLTSLRCASNRLTSLDLTQNSYLTSFSGTDQAVSLTMAGSGGSYSVGVSMPADTTFGNAALSYAGGTLTSTSKTATSSTFTAQTGSSGKTLSGTLTLTYPAADATYNPDDIAVINGIIENNDLDWTTAPTDGSAVPDDWEGGAIWSGSTTNKRITLLALSNENLSGELNVSGLTELRSLQCNLNQLTSLNVSSDTALTHLSCNNNLLASLDVSSNTALIDLYCNTNQLTSLDVSNHTALTDLTCYSNQLTSLNVSNNTALTDLTCYGNLLTSLDVRSNTKLTHLLFNGNRLTLLDVSYNTALTDLDCSCNRLTSLDLTQNPSLSDFCGINQAVSLTMAESGGSYSAGVSMPTGTTFGNAALSYAEGTLTSTSNTVLVPTFTAPTGLNEKNLSGTLTLTYPAAPAPTYNTGDIAVINSIITNNGLAWTTAPTDGSSVPASWAGAFWSGDTTNKRITQLLLSSKSLSGELDVSGLTALTELQCASNQLTSLNASGPVNLTTLSCASNQLTSLNVSGLTRLTFLSCDSNQLTSLDASGLTALQGLRCDSNRLTSLNVSGLTGLTGLYCASNRLTSLDLTQNRYLTNFSGIDQAVSLTMAGSGGSYSAVVSIPAGTTFGNTALSYTGGTLTSTSNTATSSTFTAQTGSSGKTLSGTLTLTYPAAGAIDITTDATLPSGTVGTAYSRTLSATGTAPITWSVTSGMPSGLTLSSAGVISGTPLTAGTFSFTVTATNAVNNNAKAFSVTITPAGSTSHTVTFNLNGGTRTGGGELTQTVPNGGSATAPTATRSNYTFTGWDRTFSNVSSNLTVTANWSYNGGGSGGSPSGGSGSSDSTTTTTTPEKKPDQPVTAAASITATAGKNGAASASIPDKSISDAITKAQADAKAQGKTTNSVSVALNVTMPEGATALTATLTRSSLDSLVSAGVSSLEINGSLVQVSFDKKALTEIQKQSSGNISITIAPKINLSETAKKMIGTRPVYNITVNYDNSSTVSSFGGGVATVAIPYAPANGEAIGGVYALYVDEKGNATRIAGSAYDANSGCVIFTTPHFSMYGIGYTAPSTKFTDINSHWAKESIDYVVGRGLLSGTTETTFAPDTAMTRGMLVTALGRLAGVDTKAYTTSSFTDVNGDSAYRPYIEWAYKKGIIKGIGSNQFAPDRAITREEIAVIIANFAKAIGYTLPVTREATTYSDASSIGSTYKTAVTAMQQAGIMMGGTSNKFNPKLNATRAEVSSMLGRYIKLTIDPDTVQGWTLNDAGQYLYYKDGKVHTGTQTIDGVKYFFNSNGVLQTGWVKDGYNWRYYSGNNALVGWHDIGANGNSETYYFNKDGIMTSRKWLEIDGKWYYFYMDGSLIKSTKIDDYEVDENGVRKTK